jgi:DNA-binding NtrC family response regulator
MEAMQEYSWPGNVRELLNIVERLAILFPGAELHPREIRRVLPEGEGGLPGDGQTSTNAQPPRADGRPLRTRLEAFECSLIEGALATEGGNVAAAARRLGTDRANLYRRMKRLGIRGEGDGDLDA